MWGLIYFGNWISSSWFGRELLSKLLEGICRLFSVDSYSYSSDLFLATTSMILTAYGENLLILTFTVRSRLQTGWSNPVVYNNPPVGDQPAPFYKSLILQALHRDVEQLESSCSCGK